jgi:hypothetical protein
MVHREMGWGGTEWIDLAQDWAQCRALLKRVMNFEFNKLLRNF